MEVNMKNCFVISRIGSEESEERRHADQLLKHIITPCLEEEFKIVRADGEASPNQITKSIIKNIVEADLVIADLTGYNPNVFYELAVRHTIGKPVIQLLEKGNEIPFDISNVRTIFYTLDLDGVDKCKGELSKFIESAMSNPESDNPVTDILKMSKISSIKSENISVDEAIIDLAEEIKKFPSYLSELESKMAGRIAHMMENNHSTSIVDDNMTMEDKLGLMAMEKMLSNPQIASKLFDQFVGGAIKK